MVILSHLVTAIITYTNSHKPDFPQGGGHQLEIMSSTPRKSSDSRNQLHTCCYSTMLW